MGCLKGPKLNCEIYAKAGSVIMGNLEQLLKQKEDLERQIEEALSAERGNAILQIKNICQQFNIKYADLKPHLTKQRSKRVTKLSAGNGTA